MARKRKELPTLQNIEITGFAAEGKAVARMRMRPEDEKDTVIFVAYGAPGDVADIKLDRKKHSFAEGHIETLHKPSEVRVNPRCSHFGQCGGCKWQHLDYSAEAKFKQEQVEEVVRRISKVEIPVCNPILAPDDCWEYRNKMEYTFSCKKWRTWEDIKSGKEFTDSSNALGFHIPGAFDKVLHIEKCHLQIPIADEIRNFIYEYAEQHGISFYDIRENHGVLRTLMIRTASTGEIMVCIVFGEDAPIEREALLAAVAEKFPEITSLLFVINLKLNDTISDQNVIAYKGNDYIVEEMEGLKFRVNAKSFYQTNSAQAYRLYSVVRSMAGLDTKAEGQLPLVYDLYTGAGTIANFVARNARQVVGIEYVPEAIEDAKLNSRINGIENTLFYAGDMKNVLTDDFVAQHGVPDIMIVDPPRAGMHEDVVNVILNASPKTLIYVSCNPATQARDIAMLDSQYKVVEMQPVDMFPHTHHVENVLKLVRR